MNVRILLPTDLEAILAFEKQKLTHIDEMEREMAHWSARWRQESLEHYLPLGWSFGTFDQNDNLTGYALAQPYLFHRGLMQTLWIELLSADGERRELLIDTLYRWARDKHLQCIITEENLNRGTLLETGLYELRTAKY